MKKGINYVDLNEAKQVLHCWKGDDRSLNHIGNSASSVFSYTDEDGNLQILRFTDSSFRSKIQIEGELEFINHLSNSGCDVHELVLTNDGEKTLELRIGENIFLVNSFSYAIGEQVEPGSKNWNNEFFKIWGESLGKLHHSSESFEPKDEKLWQWNEEILFLKMQHLIPNEDEISQSIIQKTIEKCRRLKRSDENYGIIHGDYGPRNFAYNDNKRIVSFDFGNSCYHYYVSDLANVILYLNSKNADKEQIGLLLKGYGKYKKIPENFDEVLSLFKKLRIQYIYLDRLYTSSGVKSDLAIKVLNDLKSRVHGQEKYL